MQMLSQIDKRSKVTYTLEIEPEDLQIRGNAMASGDDAVDREAEEWIERQLDNGNQWAWCSVVVTASRGEYSGRDTLGGCSYRNTRDFMRGGYWTDMKHEALRQLRENEDNGRAEVA